MKALKDKIEKLSGTNTALTDSLRAMQKESARARENRGEKRVIVTKMIPQCFSQPGTYAFPVICHLTQ